jgi:spore germination protein YaaH
MFSTAADQNYGLYPWSELTTVALAGWNLVVPEVTCAAHAHGTRLVILTSMPKAQVANATARAEWIDSTVSNVVTAGIDGVNVDFEDEVMPWEKDVQEGLVSLTKELRVALDAAGARAGGAMQLSWDFAWSPDGFDGNCGIDERCYPYAELAAIVDVSFVMAYDMRSQVSVLGAGHAIVPTVVAGVPVQPVRCRGE